MNVSMYASPAYQKKSLGIKPVFSNLMCFKFYLDKIQGLGLFCFILFFFILGIIKDRTISVGVGLVFFISVLPGSTDYILWSFEPETVSQVILHK